MSYVLNTRHKLAYIKEQQTNGRITLLFDTVIDVNTGENVCRMHDEAMARQFAASTLMLEALTAVVDWDKIHHHLDPETTAKIQTAIATVSNAS
jgi:macrodomain Ter protein organizer (MatP/YcbG family)